MVRLLIVLLMSASLSGCYYLQAASGQWEVLRKRVPLEDVINDPNTNPALVSRLTLLDEARDFSVEQLGLPDNDSYRSYSDLERDFVVWNVFAAPEFSLQPRQWCYPIAGCVSYRGYFAKEAAIKQSRKLAADGFDVAIGGVAAYSTLGKFDDPILSTMMNWDDLDLVALLFHELAHQVVYSKDDSGFNESFATAVEEIGVERWLRARGKFAQMKSYRAGRERRQAIARLVEAARTDLEIVFGSDVPEREKRIGKDKRLQRLGAEVAALRQANGEDVGGWFGGDLNNAKLISTTLYEGQLPMFRALFRRCEEQLDCFYARALALSKMGADARQAALAAGDFEGLGRGMDQT